MEINLQYPLNSHTILKKKKSIKKSLLQNESFIEKKIAILGGSTTSEIKNILEIFLLKEGIRPIFYESEYGKYYEDIIFENEKLKEFKPDIIYIHTTNVNIINEPKMTDTYEEIQKKLDAEFNRYKYIWQKAREIYNCVIIQNNFELPCYRTLGNLDFSDIHGKTHFIMKLNDAFAKYAQTNKNFFINDINYLSAWFGLEKWFDKTFWYSYKYALNYEAIPLLSHNIAKIIKSIYGKTKKCLVIDLDNTIWGGVIGDDGIDKIQIGKETALAEAYSNFQEYIKELKDMGIILAVCSKNDIENAKKGLQHPDSILRLEDFSTFIANWELKSKNILDISRKLNIGIDSLVFIDDNPVERELVKKQLPQVEVPDVGDDVVRFINYIDKEGYFEPVNLLQEDLDRNKYYENNSKREEFNMNFTNYDDFLKSLNMKVDIQEFRPIYLDRITQLTNRTNQFNLTTKRYNFSEIKEIQNNENYATLYGKLIDRFGDNGVVSVIIGKMDRNLLNIDLWLMSCRVIKRGMEYAMFDALVEKCKKKKLNIIKGYYYKTDKNNMVSNLYEELGFKQILKDEKGNSIWEYDIPKDYKPLNTIIDRSVESEENGNFDKGTRDI